MAAINGREKSFGVDDIDLSLEDVKGIDWAELTQSARLIRDKLVSYHRFRKVCC